MFEVGGQNNNFTNGLVIGAAGINQYAVFHTIGELQNTKAPFTIGTYSSLNTGFYDDILTFGYNNTPSGGRVVAGEPNFGLSLEADYFANAVHGMELNFNYVSGDYVAGTTGANVRSLYHFIDRGAASGTMLWWFRIGSNAATGSLFKIYKGGPQTTDPQTDLFIVKPDGTAQVTGPVQAAGGFIANADAAVIGVGLNNDTQLSRKSAAWWQLTNKLSIVQDLYLGSDAYGSTVQLSSTNDNFVVTRGTYTNTDTSQVAAFYAGYNTNNSSTTGLARINTGANYPALALGIINSYVSFATGSNTRMAWFYAGGDNATKVQPMELIIERFSATWINWKFLISNHANSGFTVQSTNGSANKLVVTETSTTIATALAHTGTTAGFFGGTPAAKQTVTGAKGSNAALGSLIAALVAMGLITDTTTA